MSELSKRIKDKSVVGIITTADIPLNSIVAADRSELLVQPAIYRGR